MSKFHHRVTLRLLNLWRRLKTKIFKYFILAILRLWKRFAAHLSRLRLFCLRLFLYLWFLLKIRLLSFLQLYLFLLFFTFLIVFSFELLQFDHIMRSFCLLKIFQEVGITNYFLISQRYLQSADGQFIVEIFCDGKWAWPRLYANTANVSYNFRAQNDLWIYISHKLLSKSPFCLWVAYTAAISRL